MACAVTTTVHGKAAVDFVSSSGCEQMVTEPTHVDGGVPDLVLSVHDLGEIWDGSPVVTYCYFHACWAGANYSSLGV